MVAEQANGIDGVNAVLAAKGYNERFADIFPRWTLANYVDDPTLAGGIYGYNNLQLVDSSPDNVNTFARPTLAGTVSSYPGGNPSASVSPWAADYVRFTPNSSGNLVVSVGAGNTSFVVNAIKSTAANLAQGTNQLQAILSGGGTSGQATISGFGSNYPAAVLVVSSGSTSGNASYNYAASLSTPTPVAQPTPTPAPSARQASIGLQVGWDLIALPLQPATGLTAESLAQAVKAQGGGVTDVNRWYAGGWNSHLAGMPFNNFPIEVGKAYFVKSSKASTWTVTGTSLTAPVPVSLSTGWNLVAVPSSSRTYMAESLAQAIATQGAA